MNEMVDHPTHYKSADGSEVIDIIEKATEGLNGIEAFDIGNMIKYICRWKWKNGIEDVKKCRWYARHLFGRIIYSGKVILPPIDDSYAKFVCDSADSFVADLNDEERIYTRAILFHALVFSHDYEREYLKQIIHLCDELITYLEERKMN